jgi:hypothetical protein
MRLSCHQQQIIELLLLLLTAESLVLLADYYNWLLLIQTEWCKIYFLVTIAVEQ